MEIKSRFERFSQDERAIIQNALIAQVQLDRKTSDHWGVAIVDRLMREIKQSRKG